MKVIFDQDEDGYCSAWVIQSAFKSGLLKRRGISEDDKLETLGGNYAEEFPLKLINPNETVFLLDFSISPAVMDQLLQVTPNVYWIDHHLSSIQKFRAYPSCIKGNRDMKYASCENAYNFIYDTEEPCNRTVQLIGSYDTWRWQGTGDRTPLHFALGISTENLDPCNGAWDSIDKDPEKYIDLGRRIECLKKREYKQWWSKMFITELEGHSTLALNAPIRGAFAFEDYTEADKYDILCVYHFNGKSYAGSIFTRNPDIDVSEIATKLGGGGHRYAAGFITEELPFALPHEHCKN